MDGPLDPAAVAALTAPVPETIGDGGPELVQLLTPEGERVENPEYEQYVADLDDEDLRGLYRDLVLVRRVDAEATALQRQGELGIWASLLGQEAAQVGSGRALRAPGLRLPDLPRARRRLVPRRRPAEPARPVPRRQPRRLGPEREELPPLHDRHRRADAARHRLRDGHPARRRGRHRRPRARHRRHRLLRRRRDQPGRRQRGVHLRQRATTPRSCSSARTTSGPSPSRSRSRPASRSTSAPAASASPASGSTATTCSPSRRDQGGARGRPRRARARRSSRRSPTGWARTRPPTTRRATASRPRSRRGSCATRSSGSRPT